MIRGIKITNIHYFHIAKEEIFRKQPRVPYVPREDRFDEGRGRRQDAAPWGAQFLEKRIPTTANCTCRMLMRGRWHLRCNNSRTRRKAVIHELQPAALRTKGRGWKEEKRKDARMRALINRGGGPLHCVKTEKTFSIFLKYSF